MMTVSIGFGCALEENHVEMTNKERVPNYAESGPMTASCKEDC